MNSLEKRLAVLEKRYNPAPIMVIAGNGEIMTVDECLRSGFGFERVYSGGNLKDLDKLLNYMKSLSMEE